MTPSSTASHSQPAPLRLYLLLGAFRAERGARAIRLSMHKQQALLAYLALYPDPHAREKLAALFWGDFSDEQARRSLRVAFRPCAKSWATIFLSLSVKRFN